MRYLQFQKGNLCLETSVHFHIIGFLCQPPLLDISHLLPFPSRQYSLAEQIFVKILLLGDAKEINLLF